MFKKNLKLGFLFLLSQILVQNCYCVYEKLDGFDLPPHKDTQRIVTILQMVKVEKVSIYHNPEATILHAACLAGNLDWIKEFVKLNRDFSELIKKRDSNFMTPKELAMYSIKREITIYFQELENSLKS